MNEVYSRLWGKARPDEYASEQSHPLAYHCLDVAAVGLALLRADSRLKERLVRLSGLAPAVVERWLFVALALHDIGKFAPAFQAKQPEIFAASFGGDYRGGHSNGHDQDGLVLWRECAKNRSDITGAFHGTAEPAASRVMRAVDTWLSAAICHHGKPRDPGDLRLKDVIQDTQLQALDAYIGDLVDMAAAIGQPLAAAPHSQKIMSWQIAGLAVLADWIGSNQGWFPYSAPTMDLPTYWQHHAWPQAERAIRIAGVVSASSTSTMDFAALLPVGTVGRLVVPSPLQAAVAGIDLGAGPQLFIAEDQTGAGKTEAALMLAGRLMAAGRAEGLFVALPTMATANAMYARCERLYRGLFAAAETPSIVLAHSRSRMVRERLAMEGRKEADYDPGIETASAACARWLADDRRKSALADCGIGTVDQAVLAVMPSKFQSLRLAGLARKVLILDEVHAHDAYLRKLVCGLLKFQAALGGSAILLSATLPATQRRAYMQAFAEGLDADIETATEGDEPYPLLTRFAGDGGRTVAVQAVIALKRRLETVFVPNAGAAPALVAAAARAGKAVCWIRNTVADAMEAYEAVRPGFPQAILFHARFAMGDRLDKEVEVQALFGKRSTPEMRAGRVLIATQVAEQSLDLDFDVMISDLAPIDALIQRAGRLWRHVRAEREGNPILYVVSDMPGEGPDSNWYARQYRRAAKVYPDHARLWLTARELARRGAIDLPQDARAVIEAVYGPDVEIPEGLEGRHFEAEGGSMATSRLAAFNTLKLEDGYAGEVGLWESDLLVPTRLGEKQSLLRLGRWRDGILSPWCQTEPDPWQAWRLSEVTILQRHVAAVPEPSERRLADAIAAVKQSWPERYDDSLLIPMTKVGEGEWTALVLMASNALASLFYNEESGLRIVDTQK